MSCVGRRGLACLNPFPTRVTSDVTGIVTFGSYESLWLGCACPAAARSVLGRHAYRPPHPWEGRWSPAALKMKKKTSDLGA